MKLEKYNKLNSSKEHETRPSLRISLGSGNIYINKAARYLLKLGDFDGVVYGVEFFYDPENDQWYVSRSCNHGAYILRRDSCMYMPKLTKLGKEKGIKHLIVSTDEQDYGGYLIHPLIPEKPINI